MRNLQWTIEEALLPLIASTRKRSRITGQVPIAPRNGRLGRLEVRERWTRDNHVNTHSA